MRVHLYTALGALKTGLDILLKEENVKLDKILGHGGLFKTKGVGQKIMAGAVGVPVSVMEPQEKAEHGELPFLPLIWSTKQKMKH